ncbi:ABC transporter permease [Actinomadura macrotermitis]|uniref:Oligopeptide transport system permease protein OppC n=1 Tax=Actinomadura macrotermitis TaxID=2585200 RepID=A0A7K0C5I2_9ACTN|nr:ABC transporter permease [Actinomadura macrotermitis]MQY08668.1 Oligopeptide transport system permease protein OppC [Actinomadura macrotermitis]
MSLTEAQAEVVPAGVEPSGRQIQGRSPWRLAFARLRRDRLAMVSLTVIVLMVLFALSAPLWAHWTGHSFHKTYPKTGLDESGQPAGPNGEFWLGADSIGRDVLVRAVYGARVSLMVGLAATALATVFGVVTGVLSGFLGGWVDTVLARFMDIVLSFPYVLIAIVIATTFGASVPMTIIVIAFFSFAAMARVVRGQVLSLREKEFIEAARSLGAGSLRIMAVDVLPNLVAPVTVLASLLVPQAIVFESTLSFLGAGVDPSTPSWGSMLSEAQDYYRTAWWFLFVPAGLLLVTTFAFNILGDGVRDAFDPRTERLIHKGRRHK